MARTSRNNPIVTLDTPSKMVYHTALYIRLSVLNNNKNDSDSIENQEAILHKYIQDKPDFVLRKVYIDNGETGVDFCRDGFQQLLSDVKNGSINCIIVKDLSRFGRNYIETGEYLEKVFPFLGVRFIAVNDGYDSIEPSSADVLSMHLKNLVNDIYARDISKKICPVFKTKQENGDFIGTWATYGYLKSSDKKYKIVIDPETAPIVREIFNWRLMGLGYQAIAKKLIECSVPSPSQYRFQIGMAKAERFEHVLWSNVTVKSILGNEVYLGHTVQGRSRGALYKGQQRAKLPKEEWIVIKNTHEAIIDDETFEQVQLMNQNSKNEYFKNVNKYKGKENGEPCNCLKGILFCGCCGAKLKYKKNIYINKQKESHCDIWYTYICPTHDIAPQLCSFLSINESVLLDTLFCVLQKQIEIALEVHKIANAVQYQSVRSTEKNKASIEIEHKKKGMIRMQRLREKLYDDYLDGLLTEQEYLYAQERYKKQESDLEIELEALVENQRINSKLDMSENPWMKAYMGFRHEQEISAKMVAGLVEKVTVHHGCAIDISLRFQDEYEQLVKKIHSLGVICNE